MTNYLCTSTANNLGQRTYPDRVGSQWASKARRRHCAATLPAVT